jgi:hypothetical protein
MHLQLQSCLGNWREPGQDKDKREKKSRSCYQTTKETQKAGNADDEQDSIF